MFEINWSIVLHVFVFAFLIFFFFFFLFGFKAIKAKLSAFKSSQYFGTNENEKSGRQTKVEEVEEVITNELWTKKESK